MIVLMSSFGAQETLSDRELISESRHHSCCAVCVASEASARMTPSCLNMTSSWGLECKNTMGASHFYVPVPARQQQLYGKPIGRYDNSDVSVPMKRQAHCWSSKKSMLGPRSANSSSVKMKQMEEFHKIQEGNYVSRSVHCGNTDDANNIFGASWEQQRSNLWSFNGGINSIDPRIDRRSVLAITRIIARLSQTIAHWSYQTEIWRALCASHSYE